jgi:Tfp pilus assembly protein PilV
MLLLSHQVRSRQRAFTFIEVLASLLFMAIVIPAVVTALTISNRAAIAAERTSVAVQLGENKLGELVMSSAWSGAESRGEFGPEWPGFRWELTQGTWEIDSSMTELGMEVFFPVQGGEQSIRLTTLVL